MQKSQIVKSNHFIQMLTQLTSLGLKWQNSIITPKYLFECVPALFSRLQTHPDPSPEGAVDKKGNAGQPMSPPMRQLQR